MCTADITGQRFGYLTVIRPLEERDNGHIRWECKCDCGNTIVARKSSLLKRKFASCGCTKVSTIQPLEKDITGERFGKLVVLRLVKNGTRGMSLWECQCDCGNVIVAMKRHLNSGRVSCGCLSEKVDLTGQRFGNLTVLKLSEQRKYGKYIAWDCKCDCGRTVSVITASLNRGNTRSCGCLRVGRRRSAIG